MRINHAAALVAAFCVCVTTAGEARAATPSTTVDLTGENHSEMSCPDPT